MSLTPGTRIGAYEIAARIGMGGMGTRSGVQANYDVTSDGRFLVIENVGTVERGASLRMIVNWQSLLPRAP